MYILKERLVRIIIFILSSMEHKTFRRNYQLLYQFLKTVGYKYEIYHINLAQRFKFFYVLAGCLLFYRSGPRENSNNDGIIFELLCVTTENGTKILTK